MNMDINNLNAMLERISNSDPLLKRGVGRDWVCVINPALVYPLLNEFEDKLPGYQRFMFTPEGKMRYGQDALLRTITGRETHIINAAPRDHIEYDAARDVSPLR